MGGRDRFEIVVVIGQAQPRLRVDIGHRITAWIDACRKVDPVFASNTVTAHGF
jgi:hypothetical protein